MDTRLFLFCLIFLRFLKIFVVSEFIDTMRHEISLTNPRTFDSTLNKQRNSLRVTTLLYYSNKIASHKKYIDNVYNEVAKALKGMVKFLAIDCSRSDKFCTENLSTKSLDSPMVVIYSPNRLVPPQILPPSSDKDKITKDIYRHIPGQNIHMVTAETIDSFLTQYMALPKVLLFSSRDSPHVLFKSLSNEFKDRMLFGVATPKETALEPRFKVKKRPTIIIFRQSIENPETYRGEFTFKAIYDWLNVYAETFVKGGGFSSDESLIEAEPKPWLIQKIPEITGPSHQDVCFRNNSSLCMIFLTEKYPSKGEMDMLEALSKEYPDKADRGVKFRWTWMNIALETNFAELFEVKKETTKLPSLVAVNPHKRIRFLRLPDDKVANIENIKQLVEKIVSGDGRFTLIPGRKLPSFAPRETSSKKDEL